MKASRPFLWQVAAIIATALAAYGIVVQNGFVYDDHLQILDNPWLRHPRHLVDIFSNEVWAFTPYSASDYYRPLMHSLNLLVYTLFGPSRLAFHLASLLLHAGSCLLFFLVVRELVDRAGGDGVRDSGQLPLWAALLFAACPANSEAVAWLGSSADLLYSLFCLGALWTYLRADHDASPWRQGYLGLSLALFLAATLSKETSLLLPGVLLVVDCATGRLAAEGFRGRLYRRYLGYLAVAGVALLLRTAVLGALQPVRHGVSIDLPGTLVALLWYLQQLLWPFQHNFYPETPPLAGQALALSLATLAVFAGIVVWFRRSRLAWLAVTLILFPLLPALANYALGMPVAERYLYLPASGFCLLLALALLRCFADARVRAGLLCLLVLAYGGASYARTLEFRNDLTIWKDTIAKSPGSAKAQGWYATALLAAGRLDEGIEQTLLAIDLGLTSSNSLLDLAEALNRRGRGGEVPWHFERVLQKNPQDARAFLEVGLAYLQVGEIDRAVGVLEHSVALDAQAPLTLITLARACAAQGNLPRAQQLFVEAVRLDPQAYPHVREEMARIDAATKGTRQ